MTRPRGLDSALPPYYLVGITRVDFCAVLVPKMSHPTLPTLFFIEWALDFCPHVRSTCPFLSTHPRFSAESLIPLTFPKLSYMLVFLRSSFSPDSSNPSLCLSISSEGPAFSSQVPLSVPRRPLIVPIGQCISGPVLRPDLLLLHVGLLPVTVPSIVKFWGSPRPTSMILRRLFFCGHAFFPPFCFPPCGAVRLPRSLSPFLQRTTW